MSIILNGAPVAELIYTKIQEDFSHKAQQPCLAIIQVGEKSASTLYITKKTDALETLGGKVELHLFSSDVSEQDLCNTISDLNIRSNVHGILIQLPLPHHLSVSKILNTVAPQKDVDGLTASNIGQVTHNAQSGIIAATPLAVISLLDYYKIDLIGKNIVIINNSILFGKPIFPILTQARATVTICHKDTKNLSYHTKHADILITATGNPNLITPEHICPQAILIDVGISRKANKVVGDLSQATIQKSTAYTPVPGGIGPITVACLIDNLYRRSTYTP